MNTLLHFDVFIFGVFFCIVTKFFLFSVDFGYAYK